MSGSFSEPDELFDVCDSLGRPLGLRKRRADVHRDGHWHRSLHCWVVGQYEDGTPYMIFQRRSEAKDTSPGKLDATVGGHLAAGESVEDALRETQEEIGLELSMDDLLPLGVRQAASDVEPGVRDYEVQYVFPASDQPATHRFHAESGRGGSLGKNTGSRCNGSLYWKTPRDLSKSAV